MLWAGATTSHAAESDIEAFICTYDWPCEKALRVAYCESSMDPRAYSAGQYGLFQVAYRWHARRVNSPEDLFDPATNIRVAHAIWLDNGGWGPWPTCGLR